MTSLAIDKKLKDYAMEIGRAAAEMHAEGVQFARDLLNASIRDGDREARESLAVGMQAVELANGGMGMEVFIKEDAEKTGEAPIKHAKIFVLTHQTALECSDAAMATPVSYITEVRAKIDEPGMKDEETGDEMDMSLACVIWEKRLDNIVG